MSEAKGNTAAKEATQLAQMQEMIANMATTMSDLQEELKATKEEAAKATEDAEARVIQKMAAETDDGRIARQNAHEKLATVLAQQSRDELMKGPLVPVWLKVNVNLGEGKRNKIMKHERVYDAEGRVTSGFVGDPVLVPVDVARKLLDGNKAERADPLPGEE